MENSCSRCLDLFIYVLHKTRVVLFLHQQNYTYILIYRQINWGFNGLFKRIATIKNNPMSPLKIGLIGFGSWSKQSYVQILMKRHDIEIISITTSTANTLDMSKSIIGSQVET